MRPLYFVTARDAFNATVWAAHLYADTPALACSLGEKLRRADIATMPDLRHAQDVYVTWRARRSTSYVNAMNAA